MTAGAIAATPAGSAGAATSPIAGGGSFARTIPFIDGTLVSFECHVAAPGAVTTTVGSCNLISATGTTDPAPPATSAGPAAATREAVSTALSTWHVCWSGSATYSDGTSQTTSGCTAASAVAAAG